MKLSRYLLGLQAKKVINAVILYNIALQKRALVRARGLHADVSLFRFFSFTATLLVDVATFYNLIPVFGIFFAREIWKSCNFASCKKNELQ